MATNGKLLRIYPLGANTELSIAGTTLYKGSVKPTASYTATSGQIDTITTYPAGGTYDDTISAGDYIVIRYQQYGLLSVGQWIKVDTVTNTGASTILRFAADGAKDPTGATVNFWNYLNSSGSSYAGVTSVGVVFEKVQSWGVREMTNDQVDDSLVPSIMNRWGSYTKGTADNDNWRGMVRPLAGVSNTAGYNLVGTINDRFRTSDAVGAHPVSNTVTTTQYSLEQQAGSKPYNGSTNPAHADDLDSITHFFGVDSSSNQPTHLSDTEYRTQVIARCNAYFTSASNTVGSYQIGSDTSDPDGASGTWHSELWYTDTSRSTSTANVAYYLHRKESGAVRGWGGSRSLSNANTLARAANSVTAFSGSNGDYVAPGNFPGAATDEAIFFPLLTTDNSDLKEANTVQTFGHSGTLQGTADDAGLQLYWIDHLMSDVSSTIIGTYAVQTGNTAPGTGTWQFCGNVYDVLTTTGDVIYSQGYEGIYSQGFEGIYSAGYEGIYSATYSGIFSQGWEGVYSGQYQGGYTGGYRGAYTLTYGSNTSVHPESETNPRASSEGPTYSATYSGTYSGIFSQGWAQIFSGQYQGGYRGAYAGYYSGQWTAIYSGQFTGFYSNQYTGTTVFATVETQNYSLWKRIG
ncbi:MAG: hypothetical protein CMK23_09730 [Porticoccaceae bacterium]|nr:hypothetical protein [Porticoccaceae bacterium]